MATSVANYEDLGTVRLLTTAPNRQLSTNPDTGTTRRDSSNRPQRTEQASIQESSDSSHNENEFEERSSSLNDVRHSAVTS